MWVKPSGFKTPEHLLLPPLPQKTQLCLLDQCCTIIQTREQGSRMCGRPVVLALEPAPARAYGRVCGARPRPYPGPCAHARDGPDRELPQPSWAQPGYGLCLALLMFSCFSATFQADFFTTLHWIAIFLTRNKLKIRACSSKNPVLFFLFYILSPHFFSQFGLVWGLFGEWGTGEGGSVRNAFLVTLLSKGILHLLYILLSVLF